MWCLDFFCVELIHQNLYSMILHYDRFCDTSTMLDAVFGQCLQFYTVTWELVTQLWVGHILLPSFLSAEKLSSSVSKDSKSSTTGVIVGGGSRRGRRWSTVKALPKITSHGQKVSERRGRKSREGRAGSKSQAEWQTETRVRTKSQAEWQTETRVRTKSQAEWQTETRVRTTSQAE